jgi:hypothetical protein
MAEGKGLSVLKVSVVGALFVVVLVLVLVLGC